MASSWANRHTLPFPTYVAMAFAQNAWERTPHPWQRQLKPKPDCGDGGFQVRLLFFFFFLARQSWNWHLNSKTGGPSKFPATTTTPGDISRLNWNAIFKQDSIEVERAEVLRVSVEPEFSKSSSKGAWARVNFSRSLDEPALCSY